MGARLEHAGHDAGERLQRACRLECLADEHERTDSDKRFMAEPGKKVSRAKRLTVDLIRKELETDDERD